MRPAPPQIPPPLGLGTVRLEGGGSVQGFICEGWVAGERAAAAAAAAAVAAAGCGSLPRLLRRSPWPACRHAPDATPAALHRTPARITCGADACRAGADNIEDITHLGSWLAYVERQQQRRAAQA